MRKRHTLFVCYTRRFGVHPAYDVPVYCYASSPEHAMSLCTNYCIETLHYVKGSFNVFEPIQVPNFTY